MAAAFSRSVKSTEARHARVARRQRAARELLSLTSGLDGGVSFLQKAEVVGASARVGGGG